MSTTESHYIDHAAALPKPSLETGTRLWVRDLPTPPELLPDIEDSVRRYGGWFRRARTRRYAEKSLKFAWYFGGHFVAYLYSPEDYPILLVDCPHEEGIYYKIRNQLPPEEREQLRLEVVVPY